jgi:hypothetical protein
MLWPHCSEVGNSGRYRCHYTLMNSSRASYGPFGKGDLQFNVFPLGHNLWDSRITEMGNT